MKSIIQCSNCEQRFIWEEEPEIAMGAVECLKCGWAVTQDGTAYERKDT